MTTVAASHMLELTAELLKAYPGHAFCDECLADKLGIRTGGVRRARIGLAGSTEFDQHLWICSVCMDIKHVIHVAWLRFGSNWDEMEDDR